MLVLDEKNYRLGSNKVHGDDVATRRGRELNRESEILIGANTDWHFDRGIG
jgi:hypothetical protein